MADALCGYTVVIAPSPRGLRHYVFSGARRALCGAVVELWAIDGKGGPASCKRCRKAARK